MDKKDCKILIVDDDDATSRVIKFSLQKEGYAQFIEAKDGAIAMGVLKESHDYDLIISDLHMPNMDGQQLLEFVRGYPAYRTIPFIMLTAEGSSQSIVNAAMEKVNQYVVKPFTPETLSEKVNELLMNI